MARLSEKARARKAKRAARDRDKAVRVSFMTRRQKETRLKQFITRARLQCKAVRDGGVDLGDPFARHIGGLCMELLDILREPTAEARRQRIGDMDTAGWGAPE